MPSAIKRICAGCRQPVLGRCGACCKKQWKRQDERRGTPAERGYDAGWVRVRNVKRALNPLCEDCLSRGITKLMAEVHHIQTIADRPDLRLELSNLRSLCKPCHSRITMAQSVR